MKLERAILYEDECILVLNKPAGLLSQGTHDARRPHVIGELTRLMLQRDGAAPYLAMHHRLDLPTSGVMVLARAKRANVPLMNAFKKREAKKVYYALCHVPRSPLPAHIENHLTAKKVRGQKGPAPMQPVHAGGDYARTDIELVLASATCAYIRASPKTGRRHQIRSHLSTLGAPILGDVLYQGRQTHHRHKIPRVMLHAHSLEIAHPDTGDMMRFEAPLPDDFIELARAFGLEL